MVGWINCADEDMVRGVEEYLKDIEPKTDFDMLLNLIKDGKLEQFQLEYGKVILEWKEFFIRSRQINEYLGLSSTERQEYGMSRHKELIDALSERRLDERAEDRSREGG